MLASNKIVWSREESLTQVKSSAILDFPVPGLLTEDHDELNETSKESAEKSIFERFLRRIEVHGTKLRYQIESIGNYLTQSESLNTNDSSLPFSTHRGFRKLAIFATMTGKVIALETLSGQQMWSRYFPKLQFSKLAVTRNAHVRIPSLITLVGFNRTSLVLFQEYGSN